MKWIHATIEESDTMLAFSFVVFAGIAVAGLTVAEIGLMWQAIRWAWGF